MTTREDRFRSLPLHGRLAVVVKHLRSLLQAVQATNPGVPVVPTSLWSTVEIGACGCVDRLDEEERETIERLLRQLVSFDPELRRLHSPETAEALIAATKAALQGAVDTGVRMLLAVKALQASAVETVVREVATAIRDGADEGELRSELVAQLVLQATQLLRMARGPDVRIEDEIRQNASLGILGTPVPDTPRPGADP